MSKWLRCSNGDDKRWGGIVIKCATLELVWSMREQFSTSTHIATTHLCRCESSLLRPNLQSQYIPHRHSYSLVQRLRNQVGKPVLWCGCNCDLGVIVCLNGCLNYTQNLIKLHISSQKTKLLLTNKTAPRLHYSVDFLRNSE